MGCICPPKESEGVIEGNKEIGYSIGPPRPKVQIKISHDEGLGFQKAQGETQHGKGKGVNSQVSKAN